MSAAVSKRLQRRGRTRLQPGLHGVSIQYYFLGQGERSQLIVDVLDELAQVFIHIAPIRVESLRDVLKRLKEAVEVHLGVLAAAHHILVDDVIVRLANVRVRHVLELCQSLKLVRRYEIVVLLSGEHFEDRLRMRVKI